MCHYPPRASIARPGGPSCGIGSDLCRPQKRLGVHGVQYLLTTLRPTTSRAPAARRGARSLGATARKSSKPHRRLARCPRVRRWAVPVRRPGAKSRDLRWPASGNLHQVGHRCTPVDFPKAASASPGPVDRDGWEGDRPLSGVGSVTPDVRLTARVGRDTGDGARVLRFEWKSPSVVLFYRP